MKKLITTFLICFCVLPIMAQDAPVEPGKPYCIYNDKIYTQPTGGVATGRPVYSPDTYHDLPPDGVVQVSDRYCLKLIITSSRCVIPGVANSAFVGNFYTFECPIDSYIIPLALIVVAFSFNRIRRLV